MPSRTTEQLRADALAIWQAGVDAVRSDRLVRENVRATADELLIGDEALPLAGIRRLVVVGAGKAGAGMAAGLEAALGPELCAAKQLAGWVNVPADCVRPLSRIHLHAARPAGVNEPTAEGVAGAEQILRLVRDVGPHDLCLCLISGGGSALLPAPVAGVSLADKQAVTRLLSAAGANIQELNTVRKQLSRIKGGGLARACRAGRLRTLVISDVLGDPLDVIASGPTVPDQATPQDALAVLARHDPDRRLAPASIWQYLTALGEATAALRERGSATADQPPPLIIGNNALAVDAAGCEAERRGYAYALTSATAPEGLAEDLGVEHARQALALRAGAGPDCLITGGEPVVKLVPAEQRGKGGRNQQLALAALCELEADGLADLCLLSGGTDGEDGPTDAAGAVIDAGSLGRARAGGLDPRSHLRRNDAWNFFQPLGDLIRTGPTHTNVCDVRVVVVNRRGR